MSSNLKHYQAIKQVHAEPMTLGDFNANVRLISFPGKVDSSAEGYHVIYSKDTPDEYHSWSPKRAFEEGYIELPQGSVQLRTESGKVS